MRSEVNLAALFTVVVGVLFLSSCKDPQLRIDGTSEEAFASTHQALLDSLAPRDKLRLAMAEAIVITRFPCSQVREPIKEPPAVSRALEGMTSLKACRGVLDGMSFNDIISRASNPSSSEGERP